MADEIFTVELLAEALGIAEETILAALTSKALHGAKIGATWIIRGREVRDWLDSLPAAAE